MKKLLSLGIVLLTLAVLGMPVRAEEDSRVIGKLSHGGPTSALRTVSLYLTFTGDKTESLPGLPSGNEKRFYEKVWDGLYLQVTTETGEDGTIGYMFTFSKDEADQNALTPDEPKDSPTMREITATDFRTDDNFAPRPLKPGPGKAGERGAFRVLNYPEFEGEIRVLEFTIGNAKLGEKPYFKTLSCLVTLREKKRK